MFLSKFCSGQTATQKGAFGPPLSDGLAAVFDPTHPHLTVRPILVPWCGLAPGGGCRPISGRLVPPPPTVGAAGNFHTAVGFEADRVGALLPWISGGRGVLTALGSPPRPRGRVAGGRLAVLCADLILKSARA